MSNFPTTFTGVQELPSSMSDNADEAIADLAEKHYTVWSGLTPAYAARMAVMGAQEDIAEFCPKDPTDSRFGTPESTQKWLTKGDKTLQMYGRGVFLLMRNHGTNHGPQLAGYGWTGPELPSFPKTTITDPHELADLKALFAEQTAGLETTFAVRIGEEDTGKHLSVPFTRLIVAASNVLYGAENFWLETWKSNHAGHVYERAGWDMLGVEVPSTRISRKAGGVEVEDIRTYMTFENSQLPLSA